MGHRVRLIPQQYVKPFVKRSKNDHNDAEAINEAHHVRRCVRFRCERRMTKPRRIIVKHRELMVNQPTQAINALRGHAAEFSIVAAKGCANVTTLLVVLSAEETIPAIAKTMFKQMGQHVADLDAKMISRSKCRPLNTPPGSDLLHRLVLAVKSPKLTQVQDLHHSRHYDNRQPTRNISMPTSTGAARFVCFANRSRQPR
jgi:hypothetical protein